MSKNASQIEDEIDRFVTQYLTEHKTLDGKELISLSFRLSYRPSSDSRQVYATLIDTDLNISQISEMIELFKGRIQNRNIDIRTITSIHLHLHYK